LIRKYHPTFDSNKLEKKKVFQKLFPQQAYKEDKMWKLMSHLKGLVEQFLVVEKNNKNTTTYHIQLQEIFSERNLQDWFEQKSTNLTSKLINNDSLINQFYLHKIHDDCYYNNHNLARQPNHPNLTKAYAHLHYYYHLQQLRYACEWKSRSNRIVEDLPLFIQAITYREQYAKQPLYSLYYDVFLLFSEKAKTIDFFKKLIYKLKNHIDEIPKKHQISLILYLINYGGRKIQLGKEEYTPILFEIYQLGLTNQRLIYNGTISETTFMNIVSIASKLDAYEWIENFIQEFSPFLSAATAAVDLAWAKALVYLRQEKYEEVIKIADNIKFDTDIKELTRRSILVRACLGSMVNGDYSWFNYIFYGKYIC